MAKMYQDQYTSFSDRVKYTMVLKKRIPFYLGYLEERLEEMHADNVKNEVCIVDYGTCDGGNILPIFSQFSECILRRNPGQKITLVFNDKDDTCLGKLFNRIKGCNWITDSSIEIKQNVGDCYHSCLTKESVDFAFCVMVVHFLSSPVAIQKGPIFIDADEDELCKIQSQAETDWLKYLIQRSDELKPGGFLVVVFPCDGDQSVFLVTSISNALHEMLKRAEISLEEFHSISVGIYFRTAEEVKKPFQNGQLKELILRDIQNPTLHFTDIGLTTDSVKEFFQAWMHSIIYNSLSTRRTVEERNDIVQLFLKQISKSYRKHENEFHVFGFCLSECIIQKKK